MQFQLVAGGFADFSIHPHIGGADTPWQDPDGPPLTGSFQGVLQVIGHVPRLGFAQLGKYALAGADSLVIRRQSGIEDLDAHIQKKPLGDLLAGLNSDDSVRVEMGEPNFLPSKIPLNTNEESLEYMIEGFKVGSLSIGNPHAILVLDDITDIESTALIIQSSSYFPEGVNVGFMKVLSKDEIQLRVVERGAGETLACGSGACAAVIYGARLGLLNSKVNVRLNGGNTIVEYDGEKVNLSGPGEFVYEGSINLRSAPS